MRSDARKRQQRANDPYAGWQERARAAGKCTSECPAQYHHHGEHAEHPDPTVCQLIRGARAVTLNDCAHQLTESVVDDSGHPGLDQRAAGYVAGWNAAASFYATVFTTAATEIQAAP